MKTLTEFINESYKPRNRRNLELTPEEIEKKAVWDAKYPKVLIGKQRIFQVTKEEMDYVKNVRIPSAPESWKKNGKLPQNTINGLIAEVVVKHRLFDAGVIDAWDDDSAEVHDSDGGVDIVINDIPCDVKCCTFNDPDLEATTQISIYKQGKYASRDLKHSFYIIMTGYSKRGGTYGTVYLLGVMETKDFMSSCWDKKQIKTYDDGTLRYWLQPNQVFGYNVKSLEDMVSKIVWQPKFDEYLEKLKKQDIQHAKRRAYYEKKNKQDASLA